jgi:hypothetical protein
MSDKIKIAYNWIGPRGPIPNTEVPNMLNIASVTEQVQTSSHRFWADNIWPLIFCNNDGYDLSPASYLDDTDVFIYPFTLAWRIPFFNYFYVNSGLFEFAHVPQHVLHHVRRGKGYILIDISAEAWVEKSHLNFMHSYFKANDIPVDKVIYLTGCMNAEKLYEEWLLGQNIVDATKHKMKLIPFPISQDSLAIYFDVHKPQVPEYDTERVPEKLFLSWNRRFRDHRIAIALALEYLNVTDRSYISMGKTDPENEFVNIISTFKAHLTADFFRLDDECVGRFINKLPLVLDGETNVIQMCQDFNDSNRQYYQNSLVSIVTETNFNPREVTLTEKSFKPSKEKHPFILVGARGTLKALQDMGFKTFNEFWDENYDNIPEPRERMAAIINVLKYISTWNDDQIRDFRRRVKPILDHNYDTLKTRYSTVIASKVKEYIRSRYPE